MKLNGKTALITGAGSGIGRGIALAMAKRGCHLALADINQQGLVDTYALLRDSGVRLSMHILDVRDKEQVQLLPAAIMEVHNGIDVLVNNAGVAAAGNFSEISEETFDWLMDINFHAVVRLTRVFLPLLQQRPEGRIVNISSVFGMIAPAQQTAYAASKFAVRGFSNALRHELAGTSIGVSVVHPGGVATNIARNARVPESITQEEMARRLREEEKLLVMPPDKAGEIIVRGIERRKARILVGMDAQFIALVERLMPVHYWKFMNAVMQLRGK